jgi:hypothetical protein
LAGAGGLHAETSAAPVNANAIFEHDNNPREDIQRLLSLGVCTNFATVTSDFTL